MSRVLVVTGAAGMLGQHVRADARVAGWDVIGVDLRSSEYTVDLTDADATLQVLREVDADAVIHCAAWVDVDGAESQEEAALRVNGLASENVAKACVDVGARLVAVSTDYVFDGTLTGRPYVESDPTAPIGAYGRTKRAGEVAIAAAMEDYVIARTAWLFGWPGKSFPDTMLRLAERGEVSVVTDEVGSPTWTDHLSPALVELASLDVVGIAHVAGSGHVSRYDLAREIFRQAGLDVTVHPVESAAFATAADRPAWSAMATERAAEGVPVLPAWQDGVAGYLAARGAPAL